MKILNKPPIQTIFRRAFGIPWTLEEDRQFWSAIDGNLGLLFLIEDVHWLRIRLLKQANDDGASVFMQYRATCLSFCVLVSILLETPVRLFVRKLPHFFGRFAAELAWGIYLYAEWVAEEKGIPIDELFDQEMRDDSGSASGHSRRLRKTASGSS